MYKVFLLIKRINHKIHLLICFCSSSCCPSPTGAMVVLNISSRMVMTRRRNQVFSVDDSNCSFLVPLLLLLIPRNLCNPTNTPPPPSPPTCSSQTTTSLANVDD